MRRGKKIGLAVASFVVMVAAPYPDGHSVSHSPLVITAETAEFKKRPDLKHGTITKQPEVYCGVTVC